MSSFTPKHALVVEDKWNHLLPVFLFLTNKFNFIPFCYISICRDDWNCETLLNWILLQCIFHAFMHDRLCVAKLEDSWCTKNWTLSISGRQRVQFVTTFKVHRTQLKAEANASQLSLILVSRSFVFFLVFTKTPVLCKSICFWPGEGSEPSALHGETFLKLRPAKCALCTLPWELPLAALPQLPGWAVGLSSDFVSANGFSLRSFLLVCHLFCLGFGSLGLIHHWFPSFDRAQCQPVCSKICTLEQVLS